MTYLKNPMDLISIKQQVELVNDLGKVIFQWDAIGVGHLVNWGVGWEVADEIRHNWMFLKQIGDIWKL